MIPLIVLFIGSESVAKTGAKITLFQPQDYSVSSKATIDFEGNAKGISKLSLNGVNVKIGARGFFNIKAKLSNTDAYNDFVLKGLGDDGSTTTVRRRIIHKTKRQGLNYEPVQRAVSQETAYQPPKKVNNEKLNPLQNRYLNKKTESKLTQGAIAGLQRIYRSLGLGSYVKDKGVNKEVFGQVSKVLIYMRKGIDYFYEGEYEKAVEAYTAVTDLLPFFHLAHVRLGSIYYQLGKKEEAKSSWETALAINPNNRELKKYVDRINADTMRQPVKVAPSRQIKKMSQVPRYSTEPKKEEIRRISEDEEKDMVKQLDDVLKKMAP